ncbi:MAG TPA: enolase C-terminal domain-like protein [Tepidisphaeraceae bacterium]|nr:enolase C-terminal domain-like protein [Tepidisphaeraceae bacterium]
MRIKDIEIMWLDVPFHPIPERNMSRQNWGWRISEICRVETDNGIVGYGETLPNYTWGKVSEEAIARAKGQNPFDIMWDDALGAGLQMACFDAAGKAAGVPVHRLLGNKVRDWCPISWWGVDMSPEDYAAEAKEAVRQGYMSFKQKARPWWDVYEQAKLTCEAVPRNFKLDFDFNEHLINSAHAVSVLRELDQYPNIAIYEEPIPRDDIEGNKRVRAATRCAIALHYQPKMAVANVLNDMCDGYVVNVGVSGVMRANGFCAAANKLFWLQLVGTAWTTALTVHLGAVCTHAQWPAVTCMNMYTNVLAKNPIEIKGGYARVPEGPGLGLEFDESALKYRVKSSKRENARAIYAVVRENKDRVWYLGEYGPLGYWSQSWAGNLPASFERGVTLETWADDGSQDWRKLYERVQKAPVRE